MASGRQSGVEFRTNADGDCDDAALAESRGSTDGCHCEDGAQSGRGLGSGGTEESCDGDGAVSGADLAPLWSPLPVQPTDDA